MIPELGVREDAQSFFQHRKARKNLFLCYSVFLEGLLCAELEHAPVVVAARLEQSHAQFAGLLGDHQSVVDVESAEDDACAVSHHFFHQGHVLEQDVAVDVRQHHIEDARHMREHVNVAQQHLDVVHLVEFSVVACVVGAPLVDVVGDGFLGAALGGHDGEDACAAAAVEHPFALQVEVEQPAHDHACGLVVACAEGLTGVDADGER